MFLLDTVVLSELRKADRNTQVEQWIKEHADDAMFISALTVGEIRRGITLQQGKDPAFASRLTSWLDSLLIYYGKKRILPVTTEVALAWGDLSAKLGNASADLLIAATAQVHKLTVVTRNARHFMGSGVPVCNPWGE